LTKLMASPSQISREQYIAQTMPSQHTPPIFLEHDNGLTENAKNMEKLIKRLEEELLENIYTHKEGPVIRRANDRRI